MPKKISSVKSSKTKSAVKKGIRKKDDSARPNPSSRENVIEEISENQLLEKLSTLKFTNKFQFRQMLNKHPYFKRVEKESLDHVLEIFYKTKECANIAELKKYASRSLSPQRAPKGEIELVINNEEIDPVMKPLGMMLHQLEHSFRSLTDQLKLPNKKNLLTTLTSLYQLLPPK